MIAHQLISTTWADIYSGVHSYAASLTCVFYIYVWITYVYMYLHICVDAHAHAGVCMFGGQRRTAILLYQPLLCLSETVSL